MHDLDKMVLGNKLIEFYRRHPDHDKHVALFCVVTSESTDVYFAIFHREFQEICRQVYEYSDFDPENDRCWRTNCSLIHNPSKYDVRFKQAVVDFMLNAKASASTHAFRERIMGSIGALDADDPKIRSLTQCMDELYNVRRIKKAQLDQAARDRAMAEQLEIEDLRRRLSDAEETIVMLRRQRGT
jgi:hypothetical protein